MTPINPLVLRTMAAQSTVNEYLGKPFAWGSDDCIHLVAHTLGCMGHEDPLVGINLYNTQLGAIKALKASGYESFEDALDERFARIAPAMTLAGDVLAFPAIEGEWSALAVALGSRKALAFVDGQCRFGPVDEAISAWRVPPITVEAS